MDVVTALDASSPVRTSNMSSLSSCVLLSWWEGVGIGETCGNLYSLDENVELKYELEASAICLG